MTNKKIIEELKKSLRIKKDAIYKRAKRIQKIYPMSTEYAIYIIAQEEGIILGRYLDKDTVEKVSELYHKYKTATSGVIVDRISKKEKTIKPEKDSIIVGKKIRIKDHILSPKKITEAEEMANLYPYIYILENSIREFINNVLTRKYGEDWWKLKELEKIKEIIERNEQPEKKHTWHQRKGDRPIDYLDMDDLPKIVRAKLKDFKPDILPDHDWFYSLIKEVYISRCVLAHMNPLNRVYVNSLKVKYDQWQEHLRKVKNLL